ncbi:hypothetical protein EGW08_010135, partial [Elysia chlorotica]
MNWVGGARKRIRGPNRNDRKIQKEFFERRRLNAAAVKPKEYDTRRKGTHDQKVPKQRSNVSQDLLAFQMSRKIGQNTGSRREQINFRVLDLGSKKAGTTTIGDKCIQNVDLPISPSQDHPSVLNLSDSPGRSCPGDQDTAKTTGHKHTTWYNKQSRDILHRHFGYEESAKDREKPKSDCVFSLDLFGEKAREHELEPLADSAQQPEERLYPWRHKSTAYRYPVGATSRTYSQQVSQQPTHPPYYDADSEVSSLFSGHQDDQRSTLRTNVFASPPKTNWSPNNGHRRLFSQQQLLISHRPQDDNQIVHYDSLIAKQHTHQAHHSAPVLFHHNSCMTTQPFNTRASECAETSPSSSDLSYLFTKTPCHSFDTNHRHGSFLESVLAPEEALSYSDPKPSPVRLAENSFPQRNSCSSSPLYINPCKFMSNSTDNYNTFRALDVDLPSSRGDGEAWIPGINNSRSAYKPDQRDRLPFSRNSTTVAQEGEHSSYLTSFSHESENNRWCSREELHERGKQFSASVAKENVQGSVVTPISHGSYGYCTNSFDKERTPKLLPHNTTSNSNFSFSRNHRASSSSEKVYMEICSLEDQVPDQNRIGNVKNNAVKTKAPRGENPVDPDVLTLLSQMLDFIIMEQTLRSAMKRTPLITGDAPIHQCHGTLGEIAATHQSPCDKSCRSPSDAVSVRHEKLCTDQLLNKG